MRPPWEECAVLINTEFSVYDLMRELSPLLPARKNTSKEPPFGTDIVLSIDLL